MGIFVLTDATVYLDELDASCTTNSVTFGTSVDVKDATVFCSGEWREMLAGLKTVEFTYAGFGDFAATGNDVFDFAHLGSDVLHTVSPDGADGSVAYTFVAAKSSYRQSAQVGEVFGIEGSAVNRRYGAIRSRLLLPKQTVTGDTTGTDLELGDVSATEDLYTAIHCFSAGTTATVIVESDADDTFASATTRSSTVVTAAGGTWVTPVAGAITDEHWRVRVESVTGSFSLAVAVGIA
jgi:hypothetical protein